MYNKIHCTQHYSKESKQVRKKEKKQPRAYLTHIFKCTLGFRISITTIIILLKCQWSSILLYSSYNCVSERAYDHVYGLYGETYLCEHMYHQTGAGRWLYYINNGISKDMIRPATNKQTNNIYKPFIFVIVSS